MNHSHTTVTYLTLKSPASPFWLEFKSTRATRHDWDAIFEDHIGSG